MASNCKQCSIRIISHTTTPLPKAYDCVAVYIAGRRTSLVVYGWWPQPPTKKMYLQMFMYHIYAGYCTGHLKLFPSSHLKPFPSDLTLIYIYIWYMCMGKNGGHVNDLGSKSCCHQSGKILICPHDKLRITHGIATQLCRYLPQVMVMNWLILLEICWFFLSNLFFKILVLFFFMVKHSIGHIWGMVGMIYMKWIADALKWVLDQL